MPGTLTCPAGHQWTAASLDPAFPSHANRSCPVCGALAAPGPNPAEAPTLAPMPNAQEPVDSRETIPPLAAAGGNGVTTSQKPTDWPEVEGYDIVEVLGRGAMGVVYKARHRQLKRLVALKMILAGGHASPSELTRFRVEAESLARLQHPHIVQIYEVGEQNGLPFFSLELVEGGSLAQRLDGTPWQAKRAAELVEALAQAVEAAHRRGVIHRDLKPGNVLLTADGTPKITDFGLAKRLDGSVAQTASGAILGTPSYMAPEQAGDKSKPVGPATDVYALGAILYELLTGRPPFKAPTVMDTILQVVSEEPAPPRRLQPNVPLDLETIALKCLEKDPRKRYASAQVLADDLRRFLAHEPIEARPVSAWERGVKWARRRPAVTALLALLIVVVSSGLLGMAALWLQAEDQRQVATNAQIEAETQRDDLKKAKAEVETERDTARKAKEEADQERQNAHREKAQAEDRLVRLNVSSGVRSLEEGDWLTSLVWFAEALRLDRDKPAKADLHRMRLASVWRQCPRLIQAWDLRDLMFAEFSPDGRRVLMGGPNGVHVCDVRSGAGVAPHLQRPPQLKEVWLSDDCRRLVTLSDEGYQTWDMVSGKSLTPPRRHGWVYRWFSPDLRHALAITEQRQQLGEETRLWDVATGQPISPPLKTPGSPYHAAFSPDGRLLVITDNLGTTQVWDVATAKPVTGPLPHTLHVSSAVFSPDSRRLATVSNVDSRVGWKNLRTGAFESRSNLIQHMDPEKDRRKAEVRLWDARTGQLLTTRPLKHRERVTDATFSPDGRYLATATGDNSAGRRGEHQVWIWDAATGDPVTEPLKHHGSVEEVRFSPDGRFLATASGDGTARVWDVTTGQPLTPPLHHPDSVGKVSFSPDGRNLLTVGRYPGTVSRYEGHGARVWDWAVSRKPPTRQIGRPGDFLSFSPDGRWAVSYWPTYTMIQSIAKHGSELWNVAEGKPVFPPWTRNGLADYAAFSPDSRYVVTIQNQRSQPLEPIRGEVRVWNVTTGKPASPVLKHDHAVQFAAFGPDRRRLLSVQVSEKPEASWTEVRVWDATIGKEVSPPIKLADRPGAAFFCPDGRHLLTFTQREVRLWDANTATAIGQPATLKYGQTTDFFLFYGNRFLKTWPSFSPDGHYVAIAGLSTVQVFDARTLIALSPPVYPAGTVSQIVFNPSGQQVLTVTDRTARVYDAKSGVPVTPPLARGWGMVDGSLSPDGRCVATARDDGTAQVWDAVTGEPITLPLRHAGGLKEVHFIANGQALLAVGLDNAVSTWDLSADVRPAEDWKCLAALLACRNIDVRGSLTDRIVDRTSVTPPVILMRTATAVVRLSGFWQVPYTPLGHALFNLPCAYVLGSAIMFERPPEIPLDPDWEVLRSRYPADLSQPLVDQVAWHQRQWTAAEGARQEFAARWHLDRLIALEPNNPAHYKKRGLAFMRVAEWDKVAADLAKAGHLQPSDEEVWRSRGRANAELGRWDQATAALAKARQLKPAAVPLWPLQACAYLGAGDEDGYRKLCQQLLTEHGQVQDPYAANGLAWVCSLAPAAIADYSPAVKLAEKAVTRQESGAYLNTLGAVLYRAGRYQAAVERLEEGLKTRGNGGDASDWFYLAMAHQRLGHAEEARRWLDKAIHWLDRASVKEPKGTSAAPLTWAQRVEFQRWRKEAEALILPPPTGTEK